MNWRLRGPAGHVSRAQGAELCATCVSEGVRVCGHVCVCEQHTRCQCSGVLQHSLLNWPGCKNPSRRQCKRMVGPDPGSHGRDWQRREAWLSARLSRAPALSSSQKFGKHQGRRLTCRDLVMPTGNDQVQGGESRGGSRGRGSPAAMSLVTARARLCLVTPPNPEAQGGRRGVSRRPRRSAGRKTSTEAAGKRLRPRGPVPAFQSRFFWANPGI